MKRFQKISIVPAEQNEKPPHSLSEISTADSGGDILEYSNQRDQILDMIETGNASEFAGVMATILQDDHDSFLSQRVGIFKDVQPSSANFFNKLNYDRFILICAASGSPDVLEELIKRKADLSQNSDSRNILHALVWGTYFTQHREEDFTTCYKLLCQHALQLVLVLLKEEDSEGFRPLELGAKLGTYALCSAFITTDNAYRRIIRDHNTCKFAEYDFQEYEVPEPKGRQGKSPLFLLTKSRESDLHKMPFQRFLMCEVMEKWSRQKIKASSLMLFIWFLGRLSFVISLTTTSNIVSFEKQPDGNCTTNRTAYMILIMSTSSPWMYNIFYATVYCIGFVLFDAIDFGHWIARRRRQNKIYTRPGDDSSWVVQTLFHRVIQGMFVVCVVLNVVAGIIPALSNFAYGNSYAMVLSFILAMVTFLQFLQFVPYIGYLIVGLQKTTITYLRFSPIVGFVITSFLVPLYTLTQISCYEPTIYNLQEAAYLTVQILFNIINVPEHVTLYLTEWQIFQFCFVHINAILGMNFLIAVLACGFQDLVVHKGAIQRLHLLHVATLMERRSEWFLRPIFARLGLVHKPTGLVRVIEYR